MSRLFTPFPLGAVHLAHRVVMAPLTRSRSQQPGGVPSDLMREYYTQRTSPGGLIVSEGIAVSQTGYGWYGSPGLYTDRQEAEWRRITDAVHEKRGCVFAQLWHCGRSSHVELTGGALPVSASVTEAYWQDPDQLTSTPKGWVVVSPHRALDIGEIPGVVDDYRRAAERAKRAGFDGVELHAANGYLPDQFLQDGSNRRTDAYGGPVENRTRFTIEVVAALCRVFGGERVGVRIGPSGRWNGMSDSDPTALFDGLARSLNAFGLSYLHVIEPRVRGSAVVGGEDQQPVAAKRLRSVFAGPIIAAGGFEPHTAEAMVVSGDADLVAFGRYFISNPDLPARIANGLPLSPYDRETFYTFDARGYTDYEPFGYAVPP